MAKIRRDIEELAVDGRCQGLGIGVIEFGLPLVGHVGIALQFPSDLDHAFRRPVVFGLEDRRQTARTVPDKEVNLVLRNPLSPNDGFNLFFYRPSPQ